MSCVLAQYLPFHNEFSWHTTILNKPSSELQFMYGSVCSFTVHGQRKLGTFCSAMTNKRRQYTSSTVPVNDEYIIYKIERQTILRVRIDSERDSTRSRTKKHEAKQPRSDRLKSACTRSC